MFIDAHVHGVSFNIRNDFQRLGLSAIFDFCPPNDMTEAAGSLLADMERAQVDTSIVVTSCNLDLFDHYSSSRPGKIFVGYLYDSRHPKEGFRALRNAIDRYPRLIKCVKTMLPYLGQHPLERDFLPLYRFCEKRKLPVQFHMGGDRNMERLSNPLYFSKLCSLFPKLPVVCLHAGGGMVENIPLLVNLWPNVFVEVEALQLHEAEGSREPRVLQFLLQNIDSSRLMFGSDRIFPEEKYFWRVQAARSVPPEHLENFCWKTANTVFGLGLDKKKGWLEGRKDETGAGKSERVSSKTPAII